MQEARRFAPSLNSRAKIAANRAFHSNRASTTLLSDTPSHFSPTSVQLKSEINGAFPCKRHQQQHLEFCTILLRTRRSGVRVPPGAPSHEKSTPRSVLWRVYQFTRFDGRS